MRALVLPPGADTTRAILLRGKEARYLTRVLRLRRGDSITAMDGAGRTLHFTLGDVEADGVWILPTAAENRPAPALPGVRDLPITLYQCISKAPHMDAVVRMAAEAGVRRIVPVLSARCVPTPGAEGGRVQRWTRIVKEARQQSGSTTGTEIEKPMPIASVPTDWGGRGPGIFFHERPLAETGLHGYLSADPPEAALLVGPEGGLSEPETAALEAAGWHPAWLGPRVLRTETAAIYAVAAAQSIFFERRLWSLRPDSPPNA